ncbi:MAG: radical SAM protein [Candidatus Hydrogenedentales bacterium]
MKATFVLPPFDLSASYGSTTKMKRGFLPSLGVGYIASMIESRGHQANLVDAQIQDLTAAETAELVLKSDPAVVGISAMNVYAHTAYAVAGEIKRRAPGVVVVLGGPHATAAHREVLEECPAADAVIPGEGEVAFADLVDRVSRKEDYRSVKGLIYRDDAGTIQSNGQPELVDELDDLPHPARHLYDAYPYRALPNQVRREPSTTAISSRGCSWGKCTFCFQGGEFSPRYRRRSPQDVVNELIPLVRERGNREITFWDDTFAVNPRWIDEFCSLLQREKLNITWSCYGHMRAIRPEMLKKMSKAGCYNIYYGFESGVQELLDLVKKGTTRQQIRDTVKWTKQAGIEVRGSFILGFPTETPEQTLETIKFACELNADWMMFYPYHMMRGTPLEELARSDGFLMETQRTLHFPSFVSSGYESREQLHDMVRKAYLKYYLRPRYWGRAMWNMRRPSVAKYYLDAVKFWFELTTNKGRVDTEEPIVSTT